MRDSLEQKIQSVLIDCLSDGFNRAIGALEESGAIKLDEFQKEYKGIGSKYYDIVTEHLEYTAKIAARQIEELLSS